MQLIGMLIALVIVAFLALGDLTSKKELLGKKQDLESSEEVDQDFDNVNTKNMHKLLANVEKKTAKRSLYYDESLE